jgi:uncharacterized integral membrane protein
MHSDFFSRLFFVDERFVMHRYHSTRWSVIVGAILMAAWVIYEYFFNQTLHLDLVIIMLVMAITKILVMVYLRLTH